MSLPEDHGVIVLSRMLDALDGRTVQVTVQRPGGAPGRTAPLRPTPPAPASDAADEEYVRLLAQEVVVSELDRRGL